MNIALVPLARPPSNLFHKVTKDQREALPSTSFPPNTHTHADGTRLFPSSFLLALLRVHFKPLCTILGCYVVWWYG
jgi:hypothetical protein